MAGRWDGAENETTHEGHATERIPAREEYAISPQDGGTDSGTRPSDPLLHGFGHPRLVAHRAPVPQAGDGSDDVRVGAVLRELPLPFERQDLHFDPDDGLDHAVDEVRRRVVDRPRSAEHGLVPVGECTDVAALPLRI